MNLDEFLLKKPMFYKEIDYTRMPRAWDSIKSKFANFKIIHIIGTNGKGSTGRFLAQILHDNGFLVGHYTSPHIFEFKERFWLNGKIVSNELLEATHQILQEILSDEFIVKTSYFEYATLLSAVLFSKCDYFICEAGMGGEYDATNVFEKELSVFTPIDFDHTAVLGDSLEKIAKTKFRALGHKSRAILNDNMTEIPVGIAKNIAQKRDTNLYFASDFLNNKDKQAILEYANKFELPQFLMSNLTLAFASAKHLIKEPNIKNLSRLSLGGRCEKISENLYADVGHNGLAAKAIAEKFKDKKLILIYNSFEDKDYKSILEILKDIIKQIFIFEYESSDRALATHNIKVVAGELGLDYKIFEKQNFKEIKERKNELYLVFGSFYLVEAFLKAKNASENL